MENNDKIIADWKPIHDKGIVAYVLPHAIKYFFAFGMIVVVFLFMPHSPRTNMTSIIASNILIYFFVVYSKVRDWFIKNNKYLDAVDVYKAINKCPVCSAETKNEDDVCPSCGQSLGIKK